MKVVPSRSRVGQSERVIASYSSLAWAARRRSLITILCSLAVVDTPAFGQSPGPTPAAAKGCVSPHIFGDGVISTGREFTVTFTPDGREVYFTRSDSTKAVHIMRSLSRDGAWQPATPVAFGSPRWRDIDPALAPDGRRLFFVSARPRPEPATGPANDMDIWFVDRVGDSWGPPQWIQTVSSDAKEGSPTVDRDGNLCFFSDRGREPDHNAIYCAAKTAEGYATPVKLNAPVNAGPSDTSPFLSPDGRTLLFYSTRPGGFGQADIYIVSKRNGSWGTPANLGPVVNTSDFEYNPSVSPDGRTLYFGRQRKIWEVEISALDHSIIDEVMFK